MGALPRIVIIKNIPSPYRNNLFNQLGEELKNQGYDLEVWYCSEGEPNRKWDPGLDKVRYSYRVFKGIHFTIGKVFVHLNFTLLFKLIFERIYVLIIGGYGTPTLYLAPFVSRRSRNKIVWSETNEISSSENKGLISILKKNFLQRFQGAIVPGERSLAYLKKYIDYNTVAFLPNTISEFFEKQKKKSLRTKSPGKSKILITARLEWYKGVKDFLRSIDGTFPISVTIAGSGSEYEEIQRIITQNNLDVTLLGDVNPEQMVPLYQNADYFLLPSYKDSSPLSCIEAISCGLPIIVSEYVGNRPEVLDGNGWSFFPNEKNSIMNVIDSATSVTNDEYKKMSERSYEIFYERFYTKNAINDLVKLVSSLT